MPSPTSLPGEDSVWWEFKVHRGGDGLSKAGWAQLVEGLAGQVKDFGLHPEGNKALVKGFK